MTLVMGPGRIFYDVNWIWDKDNKYHRSHVFDGVFIPMMRPDLDWAHEQVG